MAESDAPAAHPCDLPSFSLEAQGHALAFYPGGPERFSALLALIDGARESLKLAFYIFATDESAVRVRDALAAAARRGVEVRLMVDGFGAEAGADFFAPLTEAGGHFCCFMARWTRRYLIRNHQKIVVADGRTAMLGGFNVENGYFVPSGQEGWSDLAVTIEGPVVERIGQWYDELEDWVSRADAQFLAIRRQVRRWNAGSGSVQLLMGGPTGRLSSWARSVSADLVEGERLDMVMAYFSPPRRLQRRIRRIARKGRTRLVFPAVSDNPVTVGAARALYGKLLKSKAQIWEFERSKLHTKLIVLDDAVYFGSANFDMRSLYLNLEIVLRIEDAALARRMREFIAAHLPCSAEIARDVHKANATWWNRLRWRASLFLVSVVDYTVSRRLNLGL